MRSSPSSYLYLPENVSFQTGANVLKHTFVWLFDAGFPTIWKVQKGSAFPFGSAGGKLKQLWTVTCSLGGGVGIPRTATRTFKDGVAPFGTSPASTWMGSQDMNPPGRWNSEEGSSTFPTTSDWEPLSQSQIRKKRSSPSSYPYLSVKSSPHHGFRVFSTTFVVDFDQFLRSMISPLLSVLTHITVQKGSDLPFVSVDGRSLALKMVMFSEVSRGKSVGYQELIL
mmetsp:Transcript_91094/g.254540  ORF Transcript_91094/g.254540 Transcript_91094/m.254540 type:complete len:225 (-) Transcript_91094:386-1060(-)